MLVSVVQLLGFVRLFTTLWTAARQASLSFTISWNMLKLMSFESVMPSNHLIHYHPLFFLTSIFPSISIFPVSQLFASGGQIIGGSATESVLPKYIQGWFPWGLTSCISWLSKGLKSLLQHHSSKAAILRCSAFLLSSAHICTWLLEKP